MWQNSFLGFAIGMAFIIFAFGLAMAMSGNCSKKKTKASDDARNPRLEGELKELLSKLTHMEERIKTLETILVDQERRAG